MKMFIGMHLVTIFVYSILSDNFLLINSEHSTTVNENDMCLLEKSDSEINANNRDCSSQQMTSESLQSSNTQNKDFQTHFNDSVESDDSHSEKSNFISEDESIVEAYPYKDTGYDTLSNGWIINNIGESSENYINVRSGHDHDHDHHHHHSHQDGSAHVHHGELIELPMYYRVIGASISWLLLFSTSFIGMILIPLKNKRKIRYVFIQVAYAMGYAGLVGEAIFHLLPHSLLHDHAHNSTEHAHTHTADELKQLSFLFLGIILFYFVEVFLKLCPFTRDHKCGCHGEPQQSSYSSMAARASPDNNECRHSKVENHECINIETAHDIRMTSAQHRLGTGIPPDAIVDLNSNKLHACSGEGEHNHNKDVNIVKPSKAVSCETTKEATNIVLMLLIGDAAHNFFDGLAMGTIYMANQFSLKPGIAATIAILFHELPHKVGDVALLIKSGYSETKATFFVALTAISSLIGMIIGLSVNSSSTNVEGPISLFTAGMFLYMALVLMMSQMLNAISNPEFSLILVVICHIIGIFTGILIMIVIAFYEHH